MRYTQQPYDPTANAGSIAELLLRSGQVQSQKLRDLAAIAAQSQQQQGQAYSTLAENLGQIGTRAVGNYVDLRANEQKNQIAQQELAQRRQVNDAQVAESQAQTARTQALTAREQQTDVDAAALKQKNAIATKIAAGLRDPDPQKREVVLGIIQDPETQNMARNILLGRDKQNADYRATRAQFAAANGYNDDMVRIVVALDPMPGALEHFDKATNGGQDKAAVKQYVDAFWKKPEEDEFVTGTPGGTVYNKRTGVVGATLPTEPKAPTLSEPKEYLVNGESMLLRPGSNGKMFTLDNQELPPGTKIQAKPEKVAGEGSHFWVLRDGKEIRISEKDYRPGDQQVNARTQTRPVLSTDAKDLGNFDTALDDVNTVRGVITKDGATGFIASLGTKVPSWLESTTGWGTDAKGRQSLINLVKQTIGKTLEGGVLHKEDEAKYADILPTMRDSTELVTQKLAGLEQQIRDRKQRRLDALDDANYDVSKFRARETNAPGNTQTGNTQTGNTQTSSAKTVYYDMNGNVIKK